MPSVNFKGIDTDYNNRPVAGADVLLDGKNIGKTPMRLDVPVGTHTAEFKPPEHYVIQNPVVPLEVDAGWTDGDCVGEFHTKLTVSPIGSVQVNSLMSLTGRASPSGRVSVYDDWGGSELSVQVNSNGNWVREWMGPATVGKHTVTVECLGETVPVTITARK